jgi:hypothetical protein
MLKGFHHAGDFFEMLDCGLSLVSQHPIVHVQHPAFSAIFFRKVYIVGDINVDSIVIDWVQDFPMKRFLVGGLVMIGPF